MICSLSLSRRGRFFSLSNPTLCLVVRAESATHAEQEVIAPPVPVLKEGKQIIVFVVHESQDIPAGEDGPKKR